MTVLIADTSGLVSLGVGSDHDPNPLELCLTTYDVHVPEIVIDELHEIASYDDAHGASAGTVLDQESDLTIHRVQLDDSFPLDDGENAAVTLANETKAELVLCDEFNRLGLIHASLINTRLVTTPTLLAVFVKNGHLTATQASALLDEISAVRSWKENSYVNRARSLFED